MEQGKKRVVRIIPPIQATRQSKSEEYRQKRVVAYCRVSTKDEEQINSYETQKSYYTEYIHKNPDWSYAGLYADKGITGTSVKNRKEFNKMMRLCKAGKVDMIITKSVSRFARNTLDCLKHTRMLKALGVDVYFEEQGIHSIQPGSEFYITVFGGVAQSESENISENVKWGKLQAAREGKVAFSYKNFLGYKKGPEGTPIVDEEQAPTIRFIFERFLAGDSAAVIAKKLDERGDLTAKGKEKWSPSTIQSILTNEKYAGDAIINKTYVEDCMTKKIRTNDGLKREKYYVIDNHPAIISRDTFARTQEEIARRSAKTKVKQVGTITERGKYSSKYALTELLVCGECKTPYRRCTWTAHGKRKTVWRCINRLDFGTKYCHESPTMEEKMIHSAITAAIQEVAQESGTVLDTLKLHIGMGIQGEDNVNEETSIRIRLAEIQLEVKEMINRVSADTVDSVNDEKIQMLAGEQAELLIKLETLKNQKDKQAFNESRLQDICTILYGLKNHPLEYDDELVRRILDTVVVLSKDKIRVIFKGGIEVDQIVS